MSLFRIISLVILLPSTMHGAEEEALIPRAVPVEPALSGAVSSDSGQFRVRGGEGALRGSVALLAEQTRAGFLKLLGEVNPSNRLPIHISLVSLQPESDQRDVTEMSITYNDQGFEIRLRINTQRGFDLESFQTATTAALIYERSLLTLTPGQVDSPLLVQPWLVEGLMEANRWQEGLSDRRLYEALFRGSGLFSIDQMLALNDETFRSLDAASRAAFRVSAGAFVMALLEQGDGRPAFRKFLSEVAFYAGEMPSLLRRHFPDLNLSENSMAKWWALQLALKSTARTTESLTIMETEAALDQAITLHFRDESGNLREESIDAWPELAELEPVDRAAATRMATDSLVRLSYRCFPSYRPLLVAYQQTLIDVQQQKLRPEAIASRVDQLKETRRNMIAQAERARDFMDWFEITRARETSGAFDDYLRVKQELRKGPSNSRTDSISSMLDRFDHIFHRETDSRHNPFPANW